MSADDSAFQRGEDVTWPFVVVDEDGDIVNITGGTVSVEVYWREILRHTLISGSGLTITNNNPPLATPPALQTPHGTVKLTAAQTLLIPLGNIVKVRTKFVDSAAQVFLSPFQWLEDVLTEDTAQVILGGRQGPQGQSSIEGLITDATTARTLVLTDAQRLIEMTSASPNTVTVPSNSSVAFPYDDGAQKPTQIGIAQAGAGQTTIVAGAGVTLKYRYTLKTAGIEAVITLVKIGINTWRVIGDTADA